MESPVCRLEGKSRHRRALKMKDREYWDIFLKTGKVDDYLHYACTSEESQHRNEKERSEHGRDSNGDGTFCITHGGIR